MWRSIVTLTSAATSVVNTKAIWWRTLNRNNENSVKYMIIALHNIYDNNNIVILFFLFKRQKLSNSTFLWEIIE